MKVAVCDPCRQEGAVREAESLRLSLNGEAGELDLCENHRAKLASALQPFLAVSRIALSDPRRCTGCGMVSINEKAANKHRTRCPALS